MNKDTTIPSNAEALVLECSDARNDAVQEARAHPGCIRSLDGNEGVRRYWMCTSFVLRR